MRTSQSGLSFLSEIEDRRPEVYPDSGGEPTIGVGHLLTKSERKSGKINIGSTIGDYREGLTDDQIDRLLMQDLIDPEAAVSTYVRVPLTQNQFDALVSFVFNVGVQAFLESTLLKLLNAGDYNSVPDQLRRWIYDNGKVVKGLKNRREKEIELWETV